MDRATLNQQQLFSMWFLPLILFVSSFYVLDYLKLSNTLELFLFHLEGNQWQLRHNWFLEKGIHEGGRELVGMMAIVLIIITTNSWLNPKYEPYKKPLSYLLLSVSISLLFVSILKQSTHLSCPWDFAVFGGKERLTPIYQSIFGNGSGQCFPSGHASAGYAWISLYFFFKEIRPQWRYQGLCFSLFLGLTFGIAQQLRGAHFLSHDITTLIICWYSALTLYVVFYKRDLIRPISMSK